jgi:hypothetical protein
MFSSFLLVFFIVMKDEVIFLGWNDTEAFIF